MITIITHNISFHIFAQRHPATHGPMSSTESLSSTHAWESDAWRALEAHAESVKGLHLRDLLRVRARFDLGPPASHGISRYARWPSAEM